MQVVHVNYLAVLVCGIASMVLGYVWYGPLFGKMWQRLMGWENIDAAKRESMKQRMMKSYVLTFIGSLLTALVLAHLVAFAQNFYGENGLSWALLTGFLVWLGFVAPLTLGSVLWEGKSWKLWVLSNAHQLMQLLMFAAILGSMK